MSAGLRSRSRAGVFMLRVLEVGVSAESRVVGGLGVGVRSESVYFRGPGYQVIVASIAFVTALTLK